MKWLCHDEDYKSRKAVVEQYPSAAKVVRVTGGWMVFETYYEYLTWKEQK